jgi:serine protease Do
MRPAPPRRRDVLVAAGAAWAFASHRGAAAQDLPALIDKARPSVLPLGTWSATDSPRFGFRGTGFVVGDGTLVVTNYHVLPPNFVLEPLAASGTSAPDTGPRLVALTSRNETTGQFRRLRVVATDRWRDLALLQVADGPSPSAMPALPALPLAPARTAREGQAVLLLGYPIAGVLGFALVSHRGIVSSIVSAALPAPSAASLDARAVAQIRQGNFELLQLDATAYPGNSGGPLVDAASGQVLGVVNMVLVKNSRESALAAPSGISYAVPVAYVHELMKTAPPR